MSASTLKTLLCLPVRMGSSIVLLHAAAVLLVLSQSSVPKRCEVRLKISRVTSTKGSGFDVHFRNGNTWHLAAGNLVSASDQFEHKLSHLTKM